MSAFRRPPSVLLVSLPWTSLTEPSLGLGLLRAVLDAQGVRCRVMHLNLFLLEHLRAQTYFALANVFALNDFLFSGVLDPTLDRKQHQWLRLKAQDLLSFGQIDARQYGGVDGVVHELAHLRNEIIPAWLCRWADELSRSDTTLIGFTCMFDQTIASVALASLVKQRAPDKLLALGGYAVRPPTGETILRSFPWVDVICAGEGEPVIHALAHASVGTVPLSEIAGILYRASDGNVCATAPAAMVDMNSGLAPNYDDFFTDLKCLSQVHHIDIAVSRLPIENSRGCWWGQTKHCVFCGIHEDDLKYRAREAGRVIEVLDHLAKRYGIHAFRFSDYILPHQYYRTLVPELIRRDRPYRITAEMKANVNAQRFTLLAQAGFDEVQPGIESFSSSVLKKMDKGVSGIQNVYTLLLGKRTGVTVRYNLLYGFPDDEEPEYETLVQSLPLLFHLDPPATRLPVQVTRYAPLQTNPERFGILPSAHDPSYDLIFSRDFLAQSSFDLDAFCYYFERPFENSPRLNQRYREIDRLVDHWKQQQELRSVCLWYEQTASGADIFDSRCEPPTVIHLTRAEAYLVLATSDPISFQQLKKQYEGLFGREEFDAVIKGIEARGLLFREAGMVVGLALPRAIYEATKECAR